MILWRYCKNTRDKSEWLLRHLISFLLSLIILSFSIYNIFMHAIILKRKPMYRVFGSGSFHSSHSQFQEQWHLLNIIRSVNLISAAETIMAGFFYALHQALRLQHSLEATVGNPKWLAMNNKPIMKRHEKDLKDAIGNFCMFCCVQYGLSWSYYELLIRISLECTSFNYYCTRLTVQLKIPGNILMMWLCL